MAAAEAGFADQAHLTRWFTRTYGVTPATYRSTLHSESVLQQSAARRVCSDLGVRGWRLWLACHCRSPSSALARSHTAQ
jgi:hypothetical protein